MSIQRFRNSVLVFSLIISLLSCGVPRKKEAAVVPADQFFMLVLEIMEESGQLVFTPIYEETKEGKLKSFGPGPEGNSDDFWRVDHMSAEGELVSSQWVKDPMQAEYEYSEDGTNLEKVSFRLKNTALALRIPIRVHGKSNKVDNIQIFQVFKAVKGDQLLYKYNIQ